MGPQHGADHMSAYLLLMEASDHFVNIYIFFSKKKFILSFTISYNVLWSQGPVILSYHPPLPLNYFFFQKKKKKSPH